MDLCFDHRTRPDRPRYTGEAAPRTNCPLCWAIYSKQDPAQVTHANPLREITHLRQFGRLDTEERAKLLLGGTKFSIVSFDIEATHLKPNVGRILACCFKPLGGKVKTFHALQSRFMERDVFDDGKLAIAIRDELEKYDIIVGWNSKNFDTKFINSRVIRAGGRVKRSQYHLDGMWSWRSKFLAWSKLDTVQRFAVPDAATSKTSVAWEQWMRALGWDKPLRDKAMREITDHCQRDVIVLEEVYRLMAANDVFRSLRRDGGVL